MCFCAWWQREQADAADQGVSEQFDQPSVYDRARVSGHSRLQRDAAGPAAGQPHPETSHSPKNILQGTCLTHCNGPHHYPTSSFMFSLLTALARPLLSLLLGRPPLSTSLRLPDRSFRYVSLFSAIRAVARILVRGGLKIREWGQVRPERPKAGVGFLRRGQPAPSPSVSGSGGAL